MADRNQGKIHSPNPFEASAFYGQCQVRFTSVRDCADLVSQHDKTSPRTSATRNPRYFTNVILRFEVYLPICERRTGIRWFVFFYSLRSPDMCWKRFVRDTELGTVKYSNVLRLDLADVNLLIGEMVWNRCWVLDELRGQIKYHV